MSLHQHLGTKEHGLPRRMILERDTRFCRCPCSCVNAGTTAGSTDGVCSMCRHNDHLWCTQEEEEPLCFPEGTICMGSPPHYKFCNQCKTGHRTDQIEYHPEHMRGGTLEEDEVDEEYDENYDDREIEDEF